MDKFDQWLELKAVIKSNTEKLHELEGDIWLFAEANGQLNPKGSKTFTTGNYKVTITHGETVKVNQAMAAERPDLFKVKYEFGKADYKNYVDTEKAFIDEAITITPSKPQFKVERVQ